MLTPTYPQTYSPAYNPILLTLVSDVRNDGTIGAAKTIDNITNNNGFAEINFTTNHGLVKGDFILITLAPDADYLLGKFLVIEVPDSDTIVINLPYQTDITANGTAYEYYNNYTAIIYTYIYVDAAPTTPNLVVTTTLVPKKNLTTGFLFFEADLSSTLVNFNYEGLNASDVLGSDLYPLDSNPVAQINKKSFVKYHVEFAEAYDNPVNGSAEYVPQNPTT